MTNKVRAHFQASSIKSEIAEELILAAGVLRHAVAKLRFSEPVAYVYNPLEYAWAAHEAYLRRYGRCPKQAVFLGMNPGPFGMVQTGVPFGEIAAVRDWLRIEAAIGQPELQHPKRPIQGFACTKSEVSGQRLWGLFARRFTDASVFFATQFVANYCPLAFVEESGRNLTPDKLRREELAPLEEACAAHLAEVVGILEPEWIIGIGQFAAERARRLDLKGPKILCIAHPSPANPAANRGWAEGVEKELVKAGVWK
jgi:single-strand selective monofunctional uracil DNA glycosylase